MPDFASQIDQMTQQNREALNDAFSGIQSIAGHMDQMNTRKSEYLRNRFEDINNITKELGVITGEFVEGRASELRDEIRSKVLKETKTLGVGTGISIDMSRMSGLNSKINELSRLAKNSRNIDLIYRDAEQSIMSNEMIPDSEKPKMMNQVMRMLVDDDKLSTLDTSDIMSELNQVILGGSDSYRVIDNILGDVGTATSTFTDDRGGTISKSYSNILKMDDSGNLSFTPEGQSSFMEAYNRAKELGYNMRSPQEEMARYIDGTNSKFGNRDAQWIDPLDREYKKLRNAGLRARNKKAAGDPFSSGLSIDVLSDYIMRPARYRKAGFSTQLDKILERHNVNFRRIDDQNIQLSDKSDLLHPTTGEVLLAKGRKLNLSEPEDQAAVRNMLDKLISDENIKDLDFTEDDVHGGLYFNNIFETMKGFNPEDGDKRIVTDKNGMIIQREDGRFFNMAGMEVDKDGFAPGGTGGAY